MAGMRADGPAIGIDLGTTNSCVAVWKEDRVEIIANKHGKRTTPSFVAFNQKERLVGDAAKSQITRNPSNTIHDAKRLIGKRFSELTVHDDLKLLPFKVIEGPNDTPLYVVTCEGQEVQFTSEEISSMILGNLKEAAEAYIGEEVKNAIITVPAYFNDCQRQATKDAATIAGLNVIRIISEPTAAAIGYGVDNSLRRVEKRSVVVFDLGGGTFDVSVLTINKGTTYEVKAVAGDTHLGGRDFDNNMLKYCVEDFKKKCNKDVSGNKKALWKLNAECEKAKRALSHATTYSIEVDALHEGIDFYMELSRVEFEELNTNLFEECIKKLETCLSDAKMNKRNVDEVILVGGSTRIPKIQSLLQEFFDGKRLCQSINPDEAVAYGAAIMAAKICGNITEKIKHLMLKDVTPLSLGTEVEGEIMAVLIPRNTPIPTKKSRYFVTTEDDQYFMDTRVYQGERTRSRDNYLLGHFQISGIPPAPKGHGTVKDTFEIDANGILKVTSKVISTGKAKSLTVTNHSGRLSEQEMEKMMQDDQKFKIEDRKYKRKVDAYNTLKSCIYVLKNKITKKRKHMTAEAFNRMDYAINDATKWISNNQGAKVSEIEAEIDYIDSLSKLTC